MPPRKKPRVKKETVTVRMEFARQFLHVLVGLGCVAVLALTSLDTFRNFVLGLLLIGIVLSLLARSKKIRMLNRVLELVERPHEGIPGQGAFFFLVGVGIVAFLFSSPLVVLTAIVALTFQDAFSTLTGTLFGRTRILGKKTLEGAIGGFIPCAIALGLFLPWEYALGISFVASMVELLPIDDAFSIPLVSAALLHFRPF